MLLPEEDGTLSLRAEIAHDFCLSKHIMRPLLYAEPGNAYAQPLTEHV